MLNVVEVAAVFEVFFIVAVFGDVFVIEVFESAAQVRVIGIPIVIAQVDDLKTKKTQIFFDTLIQSVHVGNGKNNGFFHNVFGLEWADFSDGLA